MSVILITAIGSASAKTVIEQLKRTGHMVIGCDIHPKEWIVNARDVDCFYCVPSSVDVHAYLNVLSGICSKHKVDFLLPLTDPEADILCNDAVRSQISDTLVCLAHSSVIKLCRDKLVVERSLRENNICKTIPTKKLENNYVGVDENEFSFPGVVKPRFGRSSQGKEIVHSLEDLYFYTKNNKDLIFQPFIAGNIYTVDVLRDCSGKCVCIPRKELLRNSIGLGISIRIEKCVEIVEICTSIMNYLDYIGIANIEFIRHDEQFYFLEINPRFSGGVGFSVLGGYDFVNNTIRCFGNQPIDPQPEIQDVHISQRYEQYVLGHSFNS